MFLFPVLVKNFVLVPSQLNHLEALHGRTKPALRVKPVQAEIRGALRSPESANHSKSVFDTIIFGSFFNYSVPRRESGVVNQSNKQ